MVKVKTYTILVDKLADFFMNLTLVMLREIHKRFPIGAEAVMGESTLHLFWVKEVEVSSVKFTPKTLFSSA